VKNMSLFLIAEAARRSRCTICACLLIGPLALVGAETVALGQAFRSINTLAPTNRSATMSYAEAREALMRLWEHQKPTYPPEQLYDQLRVSFIGKDKVELCMREIWSDTGHTYYYDYLFDLAAMSDPYIRQPDFWHKFNGFKVVVDQGVVVKTNTNLRTGATNWLLRPEAEEFARVLYALKEHALKERTRLASEISSFVDFQEKARAWRALTIKPILSEDLQRRRIMAEDAFKNKDFEKAVEYYEQGLEIEPLWPQGQYNAALLYGELKDYAAAALHMRFYLELVPDAGNAKAAREAMYLWEGKAGEARTR